MARRPVEFGGGVVERRPVASPVDLFVQPPRSNLRDFAEGLGKISKPLAEWAEERAKKQSEDDALKGEAAFYANNEDGLAEAVRQGKVPSQYSPSFVRGYKRAQGDVAGNQLHMDFDAAFDAWEGKNSEDEGQFNEFLQGFISSRIATTTDPDTLKSLLPHVRGLTDHAMSRYTQYRHKSTYEGAVGTNIAAINQEIEAADSEGAASETGTDYDKVFASIAARRQAAVATGIRPEDFDKAMIDAVALKAVELRDPGILAWFDQKVPGKDYTYGDTAYGAEKRLATVNSLEALANRLTVEEARKAKEADAAAKNAAEAAILEIIAENPTAPIPDGLMRTYEMLEGTAKVKVAEWRRSLAQGLTDPKALDQVYQDIREGGGLKAVTDAMGRGVFGKPEDFREAYSFAKSYEDNRERISAALRGDVAQDIDRSIKARTSPRDDIGQPLPGFSDDGLRAQQAYRRDLMEWVIANPDATPGQLDDAAYEIGQKILGRITPISMGALAGPAEGKYVEPQAATQAAPATPAAPSDPDADFEVQSFMDDLQPAQREMLAVEAERRGISVEELAGEMLTNASGEPAQSGSPEQQPQAPAAEEAPTGGLLGRVRDFLGLTSPPAPEGELFRPSTTPGVGASPRPGPLQGAGSGNEQPGGGGQVDNQFPSSNLVADPEVDTSPQPAAYLPGAGGREIRAGAGLANLAPKGLVSSSARGYKPDLDNLRPALKQGITALQAELGFDLPIVSGFRDAARNKKAKGASKSQHIHGNAVDIDVSSMSTEQRLRIIRMASARGFGGIGVYNNSIHLDYGGRRAWGPSYSKGDENLSGIPAWAKKAIGQHLKGTSEPPPPGWTPGPFTPEMAMAFLEEAIEANPLDTAWEGSAKIEGDEVASRLGNLIKQAEAAGNYNAVFGNAGSKVDLSQFSLDNIMARQVSSRRRGAKSTAIGGFQFLHKTLVGLKKEMGLTGSEKFDRKLQDRMFHHLLKRRGYDRWKAGKMSNRAFALALSQEWAALANPATGRSYYDGDGMHGAAPVSPRQVFAALGL